MGCLVRAFVTTILFLCSMSPVLVLFYLFPRDVRHYYYHHHEHESRYFRRIIPQTNERVKYFNQNNRAKRNNLRSSRKRDMKRSPNVVQFFKLPSYDAYLKEVPKPVANIPVNKRFDWPAPFSVLSVDTFRLDKTYPDILCNHARFNKKTMATFMPKDTIYITILRHPVAQFESSFFFFELWRLLGAPGETNLEKMQNFLEYPKQFFFSYLARGRLTQLDSSVNLVRNGMLFDLGLKPRYYNNNHYVNNYIEDLEASFHLVLLQEYFDESLVLLKRMLCWDLNHVLYFKLNQRKTKHLENIPANVTERILQWNSADLKLYNAFNRTFWNKVMSQGPGFYEELRLLRQLNQQKKAECLPQDVSRQNAIRGPTSYKLKRNRLIEQKEECSKMIMNEVDYISYYRTKQMPRPVHVKRLK